MAQARQRARGGLARNPQALRRLVQEVQAKYGIVGAELAHADQVGKLAGSLFDQLRELHDLPPDSRRMLVDGAALHEVGRYIADDRHHRTGRFVILHDVHLEHAPSRWRTTVGYLARNHRRRPAKLRNVPADDREEILVLSALLRLACGLDRTRAQNLTRLRVAVFRRLVLLRLSGHGSLALNCAGGLRKADLFEELFEKKVKIVPAPAATQEERP